jgi:hypothetical protein
LKYKIEIMWAVPILASTYLWFSHY